MATAITTTPQDIEGDFDLVVRGNPSTNKQVTSTSSDIQVLLLAGKAVAVILESGQQIEEEKQDATKE